MEACDECGKPCRTVCKYVDDAFPYRITLFVCWQCFLKLLSR